MDSSPAEMVPALQRALELLAESPSPPLPSPEGTPKRASVALVIRVQPHPSHTPHGNDVVNPDDLSGFFEQEWVRRGDPECLFIKRAARTGDRWTSHIALPGGKREASDADDHAAAIRECLEEVGLDLRGGMAIDCGKLPDRVVTTSWDSVPLMVFCPFVFLYVSPTAPALILQPTEVASAHWVPLRTLLLPTTRTVENSDVCDRLACRFSGPCEPLVRHSLRATLGKLQFAAIRLFPSVSVFSTFSHDFLAATTAAASTPPAPLLLWGLTLGVTTDFLEMLPCADAAAPGWRYPTFTSWDLRIVLWLTTRSLRKRNWAAARAGSIARASALNDRPRREESPSESIVLVAPARSSEDKADADTPLPVVERTSTVGTLLEGYGGAAKTAVWITLVGRAVVASVVGFSLWKRLRR